MSVTNPQYGTLYGVGIGPGDPELLTLKAVKAIEACEVIAFHSARHGRSIARTIVEDLVDGHIEVPLVYPVTTEDTSHPGGYDGAMWEFYEQAAAQLADHLRAGRSVALLAVGDPLFYSSFMHMHVRLKDRFPCEIIPGVTGYSAATAAIARPLVEGEEVLKVLPGTLDETTLARELSTTDAAIVMKLGRTTGKVMNAASSAGRIDDCMYVERAAMKGEKVMPLTQVDEHSSPYFSMVVMSHQEGKTRSACLPQPAHEASGGYVEVVGMGPGPHKWMTDAARDAIACATDIIGYSTYVNRVDVKPGQARHPSDNQVEVERAEFALDLALRGKKVAVVSSGDPGVFAMASAVYEAAEDPRFAQVEIRIVPGVTAATAAASVLGAPLGHDFALISLSNRLKPWEVIADRIQHLLAADMAFAIYNPASSARREQICALASLVCAVDPHRVMAVVEKAGSESQSSWAGPAREFDPHRITMSHLVIVGSSTTRIQPSGAVYTSRRVDS